MTPGLRLLIVDDEAALLDLLKRYLERLGYQVETSPSSTEALARFQADPQRFDCVVTDLALEGLTGEEMIERMRESNPKLRALISSGYPYEPRSKGVSFLQKPYLPNMLAKAIQDLLRK